MKTNFAIVGFRHGHIWTCGSVSQAARYGSRRLLRGTRKRPGGHHCGWQGFNHASGLQTDARRNAMRRGGRRDYYAKRGEILIEALERGKHVLSDKPICTTLRELDRIEQLARENGWSSVVCWISGTARTMHGLRQAIRAGEIGEVLAVTFNGQHPLMYGSGRGGTSRRQARRDDQRTLPFTRST